LINCPKQNVGTKVVEDNSELFDFKLSRFVLQLNIQFTESWWAEQQIQEILKGFGYGP